MKLNVQKLKKIADEQKWDEFEKEINAFIDQDLTPEQKGEALLEMMQTYIEAHGKVEEEYSKYLDRTLDALKRLEEAGEGADTKIKIHTLKDKIKEL